jgi:hypothetical protein
MVAGVFLLNTAAQATAPDHYKCYKAKPAKKLCAGDLTKKCKSDQDCTIQEVDGPCLLGVPKGTTAALADAFTTGSVQVKKLKSVCTPVDKDGEGILDPEIHMARYQIKESAKTEQTLVLRDQYGDHVMSTIKADSLLVPSSKSLTDVPVLPTSDHDHYKCYKAKDVKKACTDTMAPCKTDGECPDGTCDLGFPKGTMATLTDQLETDSVVEVKKPKLVCTPVDKNSEGIGDPAYYLVGYQMKGKKNVREGIRLNSQFGVEAMSTKGDEYLFLPALNLSATPVCGDHLVNQLSEECDLPDDAACPNLCRPDCTCQTGPLGAHPCVIDGGESFLSIDFAVFTLTVENLVGAIDFTCGAADPNTGKATCECALDSLDPFEIPGIAWVCFGPLAGCEPGEIDCDGGNALDVDMTMDHSIGPCSGQADCAAKCDLHCPATYPGSVAHTPSCEGFCLGGIYHDTPCFKDDQCVDPNGVDSGSCTGQDPISTDPNSPNPHDPNNPNICNCSCTSVGGAPSRPGALQCDLGLALDLETAPPCGDGDLFIAIGGRCVPLSTEVGTGGINNANMLGTTIPATGPFDLYGGSPGCGSLGAGVMTGTEVVGVISFLDSTIGDLSVGIDLSCQ